MGVAPTQSVLNSYSLDFAARGRGLVTPASTANWFGTSDFTTEAWIHTTDGGRHVLFSNHPHNV